MRGFDEDGGNTGAKLAILIIAGIVVMFLGTEFINQDRGTTSGEDVERRGEIIAVVVTDEAEGLTAVNSTRGALGDEELLQEVLDGAVRPENRTRDGWRYAEKSASDKELDAIENNLSNVPFHREPAPGYYLRHDGEIVAVGIATNETAPKDNTADTDGKTTPTGNRTTTTKPRHETDFSGFVAEDVPENATVVEYNNSSIEDSGFITRLLEEIRKEGRGSVRTKDRQVGENDSELYGNLPIFVPEEGAVRGPDGRPYPPGVYVRCKNETVFFTDGIEP